jgi:hypothetical protein
MNVAESTIRQNSAIPFSPIELVRLLHHFGISKLVITRCILLGVVQFSLALLCFPVAIVVTLICAKREVPNPLSPFYPLYFMVKQQLDGFKYGFKVGPEMPIPSLFFVGRKFLDGGTAFNIYNCGGAGDCMPRSIAYQMYRNPDMYMKVRQDVRNHSMALLGCSKAPLESIQYAEKALHRFAKGEFKGDGENAVKNAYAAYVLKKDQGGDGLSQMEVLQDEICKYLRTIGGMEDFAKADVPDFPFDQDLDVELSDVYIFGSAARLLCYAQAQNKQGACMSASFATLVASCYGRPVIITRILGGLSDGLFFASMYVPECPHKELYFNSPYIRTQSEIYVGKIKIQDFRCANNGFISKECDQISRDMEKCLQANGGWWNPDGTVMYFKSEENAKKAFVELENMWNASMANIFKNCKPIGVHFVNGDHWQASELIM